MDCDCDWSHLELYAPSASNNNNAYTLLFQALSQIPIWHYVLAAAFALIWFLYNFVEIHFLEDLFSGFSGSPVEFTYSSCSQIYDAVVSKCRILQGSYLVTPWLSSPHLQTVFLNFFGRPPVFSYRRQLFTTPDGGTIALDWLTSSDVSGSALHMDDVVSKDESTPIVVVIPGLTSDSSSALRCHLPCSPFLATATVTPEISFGISSSPNTTVILPSVLRRQLLIAPSLASSTVFAFFPCSRSVTFFK